MGAERVREKVKPEKRKGVWEWIEAKKTGTGLLVGYQKIQMQIEVEKNKNDDIFKFLME